MGSHICDVFGKAIPAIVAGAVLLAIAPGRSVAVAPSPLKIAVFDFELDDVSAAGASGKSDAERDSARMQTVSAEARRYLIQSGRYALVETDGAKDEPVLTRSLRHCNGCEAAIALRLGADQALIGAITRVANTEYYAQIQLTDARSGKVLDQETAFFTGADDAWASGVRMLLKHGVLAQPP